MKLNKFTIGICAVFCASIVLWVSAGVRDSQPARIVEQKAPSSGTTQLLVTFKKSSSPSQRDNALKNNPAFRGVRHAFGKKNINPNRSNKKGLPIFDRMMIIDVDGKDLDRTKNQLKNDPNIEYVEEDVEVHADIIPDDPYYTDGSLWGIDRIDAIEAWDITTGSHDIVVAVVDTGVDYTHPDLAANIWTNLGEIPDNGIDDDENGFIDDIHGWDFRNDDNDPIGDHYHGTHCAGTVGAIGNNSIGVVGVNWDVSIMAMKFLGETGSGSGFDAIKCLQYALNNGARVTSNSWGGGSYLQALQDVINESYAANVLTVASAGNNDNDIIQYPAGYDNVFTVAATDSNDNKASFSSFGAWVNVTAPGVTVWSTNLGGGYRTASGTSMSCPHVAGLAGLVLSANPNLTISQLQLILETGVEDLGDPGWDAIFGTGIVNAASAVGLANSDLSQIPELSIVPPLDEVYNSFDLSGSASGDGFVKYQIQIKDVDDLDWTPVYESFTPVLNGLLGTINPSPTWADGLLQIRVVLFRDDDVTFAARSRTTLARSIIFTPAPFGELIAGDTVDITGFSRGTDFSSYELAWGDGLNPTSWTVFHSSSIVVENVGSLGPFDVPLADGYISVALRTIFSDGSVREYVYPYWASTYLPGFPIGTVSHRWGFNDDITVGNLEGEPNPVIVAPYSWGPSVGSGTFLPLNDEVTVAMADSQGVFDNWMPINGLIETPYDSPAAIADINSDGITEIIFVAFEATNLIAEDGPQYARFYPNLYAVEPDGSLLFKSPIADYPTGRDADNLVMSRPSRAEDRKPTPTIVDLDGNGELDIVVGGEHTGSVHAFNSIGEELPGFPIVISNAQSDVNEGHMYWPHGILVADLDNDGNNEIVFYVGLNEAIVDGVLGGVWQLWMYNSDGTPRSLLHQTAAIEDFQILRHRGPVPPIAADITGDGNLEIIAGGYHDLHAFDADGNVLPGWPTGTNWFTGIAAGDITGDGIDDIVAQAGYGWMSAFTGDGTRVWYKNVTSFGENQAYRDFEYSNTKSNPLIADVDGDGNMDTLFKMTVGMTIYDSLWALTGVKSNELLTKVFALDGNGNLIPGFPKQISGVQPKLSANTGSFGSMAVADLDGDGFLDLIAGSVSNYQIHSGNIKVWPLNGSEAAWPMARQNSRNTGTKLQILVPPTNCGNGIVEGSEECDDAGESAVCDADCTTAICGDNTLNISAGEECDTGGDSLDCDEDCTFSVCGDGYVNLVSFEQCDNGANNSDTLPDACRTTCEFPDCGDGVIDSGERCDDGNTQSGDGCSADCMPEYCGNGVCDSGENKNNCRQDCPSKGVGSNKPECSDNIDNDNDGFCDYDGCYLGRGRDRVWLPPDPDCAYNKDESEKD